MLRCMKMFSVLLGIAALAAVAAGCVSRPSNDTSIYQRSAIFTDK